MQVMQQMNYNNTLNYNALHICNTFKIHAVGYQTWKVTVHKTDEWKLCSTIIAINMV